MKVGRVAVSLWRTLRPINLTTAHYDPSVTAE